MTYVTFLILQEDKIRSRPPLHVSGPKRPDLTSTDSGSHQ